LSDFSDAEISAAARNSTDTALATMNEIAAAAVGSAFAKLVLERNRPNPDVFASVDPIINETLVAI
jgi:hypothetical protein